MMDLVSWYSQGGYVLSLVMMQAFGLLIDLCTVTTKQATRYLQEEYLAAICEACVGSHDGPGQVVFARGICGD